MKIRISIALVAFGAALGGCGGAVVETPPPTTGTTPTTGTGVTATGPTGNGGAGVTAQMGPGGLLIGGDTANFGVQTIATGFVPDPHDITVVSGGDVDAGTLSLGEGCRGWLTRQPDIIVQLQGNSNMLRFYVTAGDDDTTLVVNAADSTYHCNDDSYGGRNPSVDIANAGAGQYDVWVGSYQQGVRANGVLHITELDRNHP